MSEQKHYNGIDAVRILCAVLVIMIHIPPFGAAYDGTAGALLNFIFAQVLARIAVPFFFVTSGYFLFKKTGDALPFARKLLRLYAVWTVLYIPFIARDLLANEYGPAMDLVLFARDAVFSGSFSVLWYLPAGIFASLLVSVLLRQKMQPGRIVLTALLFYLAGLLAQSWFGLIVPLQSAAPALWSALQKAQLVLCTTRDGLFDAFMFMALGMYIARGKKQFNALAPLPGLILSLAGLFAEAFFLNALGFIREHDTYLFLVPCAFFLFRFAMELSLKDRAVYALFRPVSALMYFTHYWIGSILSVLFLLTAPALSQSAVKFLLTVPLTVFASWLIVRLSGHPSLKWLCRLYS